MSRTKRRSVGHGGLANPKSITQFRRGKQVVIIKCDENGNEKKLVRANCSDRCHLLKKYLSRKRRAGYDRQAREEIESSLPDVRYHDELLKPSDNETEETEN